MINRIFLAFVAILLLAGCEFYREADVVEVQRASYTSPEPPSITLLSMVDNSDGRSAHSALLISASEQVIYDPAGTFQHPDLPRRGDVHYGVTPRFLDYYERYHARFSHYVQAQKVYVSPETAEQILVNAKAHGKTPKMFCAGSVTSALRSVEPFTGVRTSFFPESVRRDFAKIPGVQDSYIRENDIGKNNAWELPATDSM